MSNRDRAIEIMRSFWRDGRYAVGFDEIAEALDDAGLFSPEPASPRTMEEIGWSNNEHAGLCARHVDGDYARMIALDPEDEDCVICYTVNGGAHSWQMANLIPLPETKIDLTPTSPTEDKPAPESAAPRPERVPEFDPAYTYLDKDGDECEYLDGRWVPGDTHTERVAKRNAGFGLDSLPAEYGPYTRIEEGNHHDQ